MSEETIFREVDDELRRDRLNSVWRRYGALIIGGAVAVVLIVAGNEGWNWWQSSNATRSSDQFYAALDAENGGDLAGAQKALDQVIADGSGQYPVLARFKQASLLARQGKQPEALAAYDALANAQGNTRLRSLALLFAAGLLVDKGDVPGVKQRVEGLLAPNDPLHNSAREVLGLAQYKSGDLNGARDSFEAVISDPLATNEARGRMQLYVAQLVAQGATPPASDQASAAGAAAVQAAAGAAAAAAPATGAATPANDNAAPASSPPSASDAPAATAPAGIESSQPSTPDPALEMAVPSTVPAATPATPAADSTLQTGAGLPAPAGDATQPAPSGASPAPAAPTSPAPASTPAAPATGTTSP